MVGKVRGFLALALTITLTLTMNPSRNRDPKSNPNPNLVQGREKYLHIRQERFETAFAVVAQRRVQAPVETRVLRWFRASGWAGGYRG